MNNSKESNEMNLVFKNLNLEQVMQFIKNLSVKIANHLKQYNF